MTDFPGYDILAHLGETPDYMLYRAQKTGSAETVIIKALNVFNPPASEIARFEHELALIKSADIDGVVRIIETLVVEGDTAQAKPVLVEDDFNRPPLSKIMGRAFPSRIPADTSIDYAVRMARIIETLHEHNISHRNITPRNFLYDELSGTLKITDFGIIGELSGSAGQIYDPWVITNVLPYLSPEQTGRMNRDIDYPTDLYSLGIVFYEMFTGRVPFSSHDPMDIIHAHIARPPDPPDAIAPDIPATLSGIVMKLLAKTPEERYQTGFGLAFDLLKCREQMKSKGEIEPFELGRQDICLKLNMPRVLIGRDREIKMLTDACERAAAGAMEVVFVSGEPGIGKSALVHEIEKTIVSRQGFFLSGKYGQMRRHVPYSAIIQAFQKIAEKILAQSESEIQQWKNKLAPVLGASGKIITDMIPKMEQVLGAQPDLQELGAEEARNLLSRVFKRFVQAIADRNQPVVLFLDDLHKADPDSLALMEKLAEDGGLDFFLLIAAWRENEVPPHHPLRHTMTAIKNTGIPFENLPIEALNAQDVKRLLAGILRCRPDVCDPMAEVIHEKTLGNPFFVHQFIKTLYEENCLEMDPTGQWRFDIEAIREMQITDNAVDFMADKLRQLTAEARELIGVCACIGNRFGLESLASAAGRPISDILPLIDRLVLDGFIIARHRQYHFSHDRIYEAAYSLLAPEKRKKAHYRIGKRALENTPRKSLHNLLFYIVDQLNFGSSMIETRAEAIELAHLNLKAGLKARDAAAFTAAVKYLAAGIAILPDDAWTSEYDLAFSLHLQQMECRYITRSFEAAERLFNIITANAASSTDKAKACTTMIIQYTNQQSFRKALDLGVKTLDLFGIKISSGIGTLPVLAELIKIKWRLRQINIEEIVNLPQTHDPDRIALNSLLLAMATPAYYVNRNLFGVIVMKGANEMLKNGLSSHAEVNFIGLAAILQNVLKDYDRGYQIAEMALALNEKSGNRSLACQVHHTFAFFIQHWKRHAKHNINVYQKVYQFSLDAGNLIFAGHSINATTDCRLMIGDSLDLILEETRKYENMMDHVKDPFITARFRENIQMAKCLMGLTRERISLNGDKYDEASYTELLLREKNLFGLCYTLLYKLILLYLHGRYESALEVARRLDRYIDAPIGTMLVPLHFFYYSLALAAVAKNKKAIEKRRLLKKIRKHQRKMKQWAVLCPENFAHKHDLVEAELAAAGGNSGKSDNGGLCSALYFYHAAIKGARQNAYINEEALACERAALFYLGLNAKEEAGIYLNRAHLGYGTWRAAALQKGLEDRHPEFFTMPAQVQQDRGGIDSDDTHKPAGGLLDLDTVMKVSRAISGEIVLARLLEKIMEISVANAGAQKGFLILETDKKLAVEAGIDPDRNMRGIENPIPLDACQGLSGAVVNYVFRTMEPVILANASEQGPFKNDTHVKANKCKSILCMPILNKGRINGILYMENNLSANVFTEERLELLGIIAGQAAISLENARLFEMATTDGLTRLFVHRYFQLLLDQEIERSRRNGRPCSLLMIDIDNFKHFNDTYGHLLGDDVLKKMASVLTANTRAVDIVARYGGEEFVVVLPETDIHGALTTAEKIRGEIEKIKIHHDHHTLSVTASVGAATFPEHAAEKTGLIRLADEALYRSKNSGKNRVSVCTA